MKELNQKIVLEEVKEIQASGFVEASLDRTVETGEEQLTGGADDGADEMATENLPFGIAGSKVQVAIGGAVFGGEGAGQRDDLVVAGEGIGTELFGGGVQHADGEVVDCAERLYAGKANSLLCGEREQRGDNFFALVDPDNEGILKSAVFHGQRTPF